jgi:uncharacterized protein YndB with AHSA1/START domain
MHMSVSFCPIDTIDAPIERVWSYISLPSNYAFWWDAQTRSIDPKGPAVPEQVIHAQSGAFGRQWNVKIVIEAVELDDHRIHLTTTLPLGITIHNHITCLLLDSTHCRVSFG